MPERVNTGASNDALVDIFKKHLGPAFKGEGWEALMVALAAGDQIVQDNNQYAYDQLFKSTASGKYLYERAADVGVAQPSNVGMSDDRFRDFVVQKTTGQLVANALSNLLETFYGPDACRANLSSTVTEPVALSEGDTLTIAVDDIEYVVTFKAEQFKDITAATMSEIAAVINRVLYVAGSNGYAVASLDFTSGKNTLKLYSGTIGLCGSVAVVGGKTQNVLKFPTNISLFPGAFNSLSWAVSVPTPGLARYTASGTTMPTGLIDAVAGDYANVYGSNFNAANRGTFKIEEVSVDYVEGTPTAYFTVTNDKAVVQGSVVTGVSDVLVFRPTKATLGGSTRTAFLTQPSSTGFTLNLPVTTQVVNRKQRTGAYANVTPEFTISTASRAVSGVVTVVTTEAHGLAVRDQIFIDGVRNAIGPNPGRFNGLYAVARVVNATTFEVNTGLYSTASGTGGKLTTMKAVPSTIPGPYALDPETGLAVTGTETTLTTDFSNNRSYSQLQVASTAGFPDSSGWLALGFGTKDEIGPIPYYGLIDATRLKIDPNFVSNKTVLAGAKVTLLASKTGWKPNGLVGQFYATDSTAGLVAAIDTIQDVSAAGSVITKNVVYPNDRGLGGEGKAASDKLWVWGP